MDKIQGDITYSNGRSFHFDSKQQFEEFLLENISIELDRCYHTSSQNKKNIYINFLLDEIEFEILIPTDFKIFNDFKPVFDGFISIDERIYLNERTYADFYTKEIKKILVLFSEGKSNINSLTLIENKFVNAKKRLLNNQTETIFDNATAISICKKIQTPFIRGLLKNSKTNIIHIHKIAMNCYNKYGGHVITFLLKLPILEFANRLVKQIKTYKNEDGCIPAFKIKYANNTIVLRFYEKKYANAFKTNAVIATSGVDKKEIFRLSYDGKLNAKIANEGKKISLFIDKFNTKQLYSEIEQGHCLNPKCNKPLTDQRSLITGYGKCCADNLGIDYYE